MDAILVDVTKCTGCERCLNACVQANGIDPLAAQRERSTSKDGLSANRLSTIVKLSGNRFARKSCMHCQEPNCVAACLVGAIRKSETGAVVYDADKCIGCRYCMLACSFHVPRYEWDTTSPLMRKCSLCAERTLHGAKPACVDACPSEALTFGRREELVARAHRQIAAHSKRYLPRVWGEAELGGTSILYISDIDLTRLGWPAVEGAAPISDLTDPLIHATPIIGLSVLAGSWSLSTIIKRRNKIAAQKRQEEKGD